MTTENSLQAPKTSLPLTTQDAHGVAQYGMYIDGQFTNPQERPRIDSIDPATGQLWAQISQGNQADAEQAVAAAYEAYSTGPWSKLRPSERGAYLRKIGDLVAEHAEWLAYVEQRDNGKLIAELSMQLKYMANYYYYYGGLADKMEGSYIPTDKPNVINYTKYESLGVVACITPWNSPLPLASMKIAPALAAGNTVVLKPSEFTSASLLELVKVFELAGLPKGVVNVVTGFGAEVGKALVEHPKVAKIAFTGGPEAGRIIAEQAAKTMKRLTLELGGKSPNIIFEDANQEQALKGAIAGIFAASGQTCVAGSRLLVQESIYESFLQELIAQVKGAQFGHPAKYETQIAPISTKPQLEKIKYYVEVAKKDGARLVLGGQEARVEGYPNGFYFEPTIFADVNNEMRIAQEEVFGPVLSVIPFKDEEDAIRIANDIDFGLAAGIWTQSISRALRMAEKVRAGTVWINNYRSTSVTSPFGGFKMSGMGRECGIEGMRQYLEVKSVWISTEDVIANPFVRR